MKILLITAAAILGFFLQILLLQGISKLFKVKSPNYKISFWLALAIIIPSLIFEWIDSYIISSEILAFILGLLIPFLAFYPFATKFYAIKMRKGIGIYLTLLVVNVVIGIAILLPLFLIFKPYALSGNGMAPTLKDGDYALFNKFDKNYERNEIVNFLSNIDNRIIISRIIGLPGETVQIKDAKVFINGEMMEGQETSGDLELTLKEKEYFVLSDNREHGAGGDSRTQGPISEGMFKGTYLIRLPR